MPKIIRVGVSACLLGEKVRYDGGHKLDRLVIDSLGPIFTLVPVCPEVESGMTIPREAMRLEGEPAAPTLVTIQNRLDKTGQMTSFCRAKVRELVETEVCGFVFKKRSPSCSLSHLVVYRGDVVAGSASGLFAGAVIREWPLLPVVEEDGLRDEHLRAAFIARVVNYSRLRSGPSSET